MSASRPTKAEQRRAKIEAVRAAQAAAERRRRWMRIGIAGGAGLVVVALIVAGVLLLGGNHNNKSSALPSAPATVASGRTSTPPWSVPTDAAAAVQAAGLPILNSEGTAEHIHAHLDVIVNGSPVSVPADVGIEGNNGISPLHTHDGTGVIHIESPKVVDFSLGQFFTEWQVSLSSTNIGGLRAGGAEELKAYVNGKPYTGDPAGIVLHAHDEIALVYGTAAQQANVPSSYSFGPDL